MWGGGGGGLKCSTVYCIAIHCGTVFSQIHCCSPNDGSKEVAKYLATKPDNSQGHLATAVNIMEAPL